ncbi:MAG: (Fe-S)-binding protein [Candidatus Bathyarchaeia archaeon]|jgi:ArsR family metal-binding transcriptional regulator
MSETDFMSLFFPEDFVKKIEITEIMPCAVEADGIRFLAQADRPVTEVLQVLFLVFPNATYSEKIGFLSYKTQERIVSIFPNGKISMTHVKDKETAIKLVEELRKTLNRASIYLKTHGLPGNELAEQKKALTAKKLYDVLPKTNCKKCGEQSCFAFATKLLIAEKRPEDCKPLSTEQKTETRLQLEKMLSPIKL